MSRNFVSEFEDVNQRNLHDNTFVRRQIGDDDEIDDVPLTAANRNNNKKESSSTPVNDTEKKSSRRKNASSSIGGHVDLPNEERTKIASGSISAWWKTSVNFASEHQRELQIGVFALVMIIALVLLVDVASKSGQAPEAKMPRLLFFLVDGVTVKDFKDTASARRVPSMNFFAAQSENCRPEVADSSSFSHPYDRCVLSDPSSHTGTLFSLMTGSAFTGKDQETGKALTLRDVSKYNFTTFLRQATTRGLTSAVLGNTPILTINNPLPPSEENPSPHICGILDTECVLTAENSKSSSGRLPECKVPSTAKDPLGSMITSSSSCNVAFQSLISENDAPDTIWKRVKHVLAQDADVVFIQIPEATFNSWKKSHEITSGGSSSSSKEYDAAVNREFSFDAALFQADKLFSKILRDIAVRSAQEGEEWLSFLAVSSAEKEPDLILASNIIENGQRKDVQMLLDSPMKKMSPARLSTIITEWLARK